MEKLSFNTQKSVKNAIDLYLKNAFDL